MSWELHLGEAQDVLPTLGPGIAHALVTDPPAGIRFMGQAWDQDHGGRRGWVEAFAQVFFAAREALVPGAHGAVWALPRTSHWTACALEDAGFEVRDVVTHHFGTGFPKSLDVAKAMASDDAKRWQGWGTALKPATEHWILVRNPLDRGTVAENVVEHGAGGLHIEAARIGHEEDCREIPAQSQGLHNPKLRQGQRHKPTLELKPSGRWPPNLAFTHCTFCVPVGTSRVRTGTAVNRNRDGEKRSSWYDTRRVQSGPDAGYAEADGRESVEAFECCHCCPVGEMDRQSGERPPGMRNIGARGLGYQGGRDEGPQGWSRLGDSGTASRFFPRFRYTAKASPAERGDGNVHPTVKPVSLMQWLITLVTPPGGVVLDPFAGSGTTLVAATRMGFDVVGIERDPRFADLARRRVEEDAPLFHRGAT